MKKTLSILSISLSFSTFALADISLVKNDNPTQKQLDSINATSNNSDLISQMTYTGDSKKNNYKRAYFWENERDSGITVKGDDGITATAFATTKSKVRLSCPSGYYIPTVARTFSNEENLYKQKKYKSEKYIEVITFTIDDQHLGDSGKPRPRYLNKYSTDTIDFRYDKKHSNGLDRTYHQMKIVCVKEGDVDKFY